MLTGVSLTSFLIEQTPTLFIKLFEQIYLAGFATLIAILIGMPFGILAKQHPCFKHFALASANILQTIPSLALLAFLLPFLGIGAKPALVALAVYALLPIMRNTVTGLENVPAEMVEAADGLGFTPWQKLAWVELPLAVPVILAGIRTATAMSVGIATLAAFIGAGGLGDFIYQGLVLNDNRLVLLGAIPAALLALTLDYIIGKTEQYFIDKRRQPTLKATRAARKIFSPLLLLIVLFCVGLFNWQHATHGLGSKQTKTLRIATKNSTEQLILGEIMAQLISAKTQLQVERIFNLGTTAICHHALVKGEIDLYPEYTGTAYQVILQQKKIISEQQMYQELQTVYNRQFHLTWLPPFGFDNAQALIVRQNFAKQHHIKTISDLLPFAKQMVIGVQAEFLQRPDGFPGLRKTYGMQFADIKIMNSGLMYSALKQNDVDVILGDATDGRIITHQLQILMDDKKLFPSYYAAPVVQETVLQKYPEIRAALAPLAGVITNEVMQKLNAQVDIEHRSPAEVARNFLQMHHAVSLKKS